MLELVIIRFRSLPQQNPSLLREPLVVHTAMCLSWAMVGSSTRTSKIRLESDLPFVLMSTVRMPKTQLLWSWFKALTLSSRASYRNSDFLGLGLARQEARKVFTQNAYASLVARVLTRFQVGRCVIRAANTDLNPARGQHIIMVP